MGGEGGGGLFKILADRRGVFLKGALIRGVTVSEEYDLLLP